MKRYFIIISVSILQGKLIAQNVGIGTTTPVARLHVKDSNVVFTGPVALPASTNFNPPIQGPGTRMMWYPQKGAFRAGTISGTQWNKDSIGRNSFTAGFNNKALLFASVAMGDSTTASGYTSTAMGAWTVASNTVATAMGEATIASGYGSTSMGESTYASGDYSTAMGMLTTAAGLYSTSMGERTTASGYASTATGSYTAAAGDYSVAAGYGSSAYGPASIAMGHHAMAWGDTSVAIGTLVTASGFASTAMGASSTASGSMSTALGGYNTASGNFSTALGLNTIASGYSSIAMGSTTHATELFSTAMGYYTTASGLNSTAMGALSTATGSGSLATGGYTTASGTYSTAMGNHTTASGLYSTAMGLYTNAKQPYSLAIGTFNDTAAIGSLFEVGNGYGVNGRSNALTVISNGNIGIGKSNPSLRLEVCLSSSGSAYHPDASVGIEQNSSHYLNLITNNSSQTGILFGNAISNADGGITYRATNVSDPRALYFRTANLDRMVLYNNGNAWLAGTLIQNSDARLKENTARLSNSLSNLQQLNGYTYNWKDKKRDPTQQIGLLAQELQKVYPQLVKENSEGELSVNYIGLIPVLIEGIKEQQKQIEELKREIKRLSPW